MSSFFPPLDNLSQLRESILRAPMVEPAGLCGFARAAPPVGWTDLALRWTAQALCSGRLSPFLCTELPVLRLLSKHLPGAGGGL